MELVNNLGPIGRLLYKSNVCAIRYIGYYFNEHLTETNFYDNVHILINPKDIIPNTVTCLMINTKISFEHLNQIICDTNIKSLIFFKDIFVDNINANIICKNITTLVAYNTISLNIVHRFFPNIKYIYMFRQNESSNEKQTLNFINLRGLYIYSSGSEFSIRASHLESISIYSSLDDWILDMTQFPHVHTLRIDEKIQLKNLDQKSLKILQYYPSIRPSNKITRIDGDSISLTGKLLNDLILPPTRKYSLNLQNNPIVGIYVNDRNFIDNNITNEILNLQIYDNTYPLKTCSQRFTNAFFKYFPFPDDVNNELIERFNIPKQRENLILIFNFDFMSTFDTNTNWQYWYEQCKEKYHRIPIIIQNGQLLLTDILNDGSEKKWPNMVTKTRNECIIFIPEEELLYINCSPLRSQTLIAKIKTYREQKYKINKLWLVTNGFEISTKDIEESIENLVIVYNKPKMYLSF